MPSGQFVRQNAGSMGEYRAFVPDPLPPPIDLPPSLVEAEQRALLALGRLDGVMRYLPDPDLFLWMYVRNEAVLSSQIEGTQSTLSDLLLFEHEATPSIPTTDVAEVSRYVRATRLGVDLLAELPISTRLLSLVHAELLAGTRGGDKSPGQVRVTQNWIGGSMPGNAHYVPPPPHLVGELLTNLEKFLNDVPRRTPPLLKAGLAHAQFETIHPYLDGNGRLGRLLITLLLVSEKVLEAPLLYLSLYFKEHKAEYYERLQRVRTHGEWIPWLEFFFAGVESVARSASDNVQALMTLFKKHEDAIAKVGGRGVSTMLRVYKIAQREAVVDIPSAAKELELTHPSVSAAVRVLEKLGILLEVTGKARDRRYLYSDYVKQLSGGSR